jgi:hypothetical protein
MQHWCDVRIHNSNVLLLVLFILPQVGALLNQLQELLRRAEVERDRAKLQLKRQRVSGLMLLLLNSAVLHTDAAQGLVLCSCYEQGRCRGHAVNKSFCVACLVTMI